MHKVKIVLVGSHHTGKTSIVNKYVLGKFTIHTVSTTQPAFCQKQITHRDHQLSLEIWDTAGQERYHALSPLFYRDADAGIVVFDLTDKDSFDRATKWIDELKKERGDNIHIVIAGNKVDLLDKRVVSAADAQRLAASINAPYFETSAKTAENIESLFNSISDNIVNQILANNQTSGDGKGDQKKSLRASIRFDQAQPQSSGCSC